MMFVIVSILSSTPIAGLKVSIDTVLSGSIPVKHRHRESLGSTVAENTRCIYRQVRSTRLVTANPDGITQGSNTVETDFLFGINLLVRRSIRPHIGRSNGLLELHVEIFTRSLDGCLVPTAILRNGGHDRFFKPLNQDSRSIRPMRHKANDLFTRFQRRARPSLRRRTRRRLGARGRFLAGTRTRAWTRSIFHLRRCHLPISIKLDANILAFFKNIFGTDIR